MSGPDTLCAFFRSHLFRIRLCSFVKRFSVLLSVSERIATMRPSGVSGPIPERSCLNSSHCISAISFESRIPYCVWNEDTIKS